MISREGPGHGRAAKDGQALVHSIYTLSILYGLCVTGTVRRADPYQSMDRWEHAAEQLRQIDSEGTTSK